MFMLAMFKIKILIFNISGFHKCFHNKVIHSKNKYLQSLGHFNICFNVFNKILISDEVCQ